MKRSSLKVLLVPVAVCLACEGPAALGPATDTPSTGTEAGETGEGSETTNELERISDYILSLGTPVAMASQVVEQGAPKSEASGNYACVTRKLEETRRFDDLVGYAGNSHALYPGAIVSADGIYTGVLTPKVLPRAPLTFSASLEGVLEGSVARTIEEPSLSTFREAMQDILKQKVIGQPPAQIAAQIERVYSSEQLDLAIDVSADFPEKGALEASLRMSDSEVYSRFVIRFTQTYYTVDVDPPSTPADLFHPDTKLGEVEKALAGDPPAYVASVSYGRTVLFAVTSKHATKDVEAALQFAYYDKVTADGSVSLTHQEVLEQSEITAFILGGNGQAAAKAVFGFDELRDFIESGATWSKESPGAPIAYKLAWLADNSPARWSAVTNYEATDCERVTQNVRVALRSITVQDAGNDAGSNLELFGKIGVVDQAGQEHVLWSADSDNPASIADESTWPSAGEIGASVVGVTPGPGGSFDLLVDLYEDDFGSNDAFGLKMSPRPYETGWRGSVSVPVAHEDQKVLVEFELLPVE